MTITRESFGEWMQYVLHHRYIDVDGAHGAQCWDLFGHFCDWFGIPRVNTYGGRWSGWAGALVDQYWSNGASANFDLIGPEEPAQLGDTAVWGDSYWYYPKTHVAQVYADAGGLLLCLSQNSSASLPDNPYPGASTGPTILQHLPKQGLIGYLRPRAGISYQGGTTTAPKEEGFLMALNDEAQDNIYKAMGRVDPAVAEIKDALGKLTGEVSKISARVFGRDVQRWYHPENPGDVRTYAFDGSVAARSTDVNDVLSTNRIIEANTNKILTALSGLPGIDANVIAGLREQLAAELKAATASLSVTLTVKDPE